MGVKPLVQDLLKKQNQADQSCQSTGKFRMNVTPLRSKTNGVREPAHGSGRPISGITPCGRVCKWAVRMQSIFLPAAKKSAGI